MADEPSGKSSATRTTIIVAIIGLLGTITSAVLANLDKVESWLQLTGRSTPALVTPQSVPCSTADASTRSVRPGQERVKFEQPKVSVGGREIPLDGCISFSKQCGQPLWDWFCREQHYKEAGGAEVTVRDETFVFEDRKYCEQARGQSCGAPQYVTCLR